MKIRRKKSNLAMFSKNNQSGAALVVALVILLVITLIGVSNMNAVTTEMKMATATKKRSELFALAERALREIENDIQGTVLNTTLLANTFDGNGCSGGFCFSGSYSDADVYRFECNPSSTDAALWLEESTWKGSSTHYATINLPTSAEGGSRSAKYIAEFLCFVDNGAGTFGPTDNNGIPLIRVTVLVEDSDRYPVMLQSNFVLQI